MKTLAILALIGLASTASATIIHPSTIDALNTAENRNGVEFFDEYRTIPYIGPDGKPHNPNGWVSLYGHLNGGIYFFTDLHTLSWDFTGTDFSLVFIHLYGPGFEEVFKIGSRIEGETTLPEGTNILDLLGRGPGTNIPENVVTLDLLALSVLILLLHATRYQHSSYK